MEIIPDRGEIWWVSLDPTLSSEIHKTRPDRCATVEFAEAKPADLDSNYLRWTLRRSGKRLNPSSGQGTASRTAGRGYARRIRMLEEVLRQIMQLG